VLRLMQARTRAREAHEQASRSLQFAATDVLSLAFLPRWLQQVEQLQQLGASHMVSDSYQPCEEWMLQRRVQFLLCYGHAAVKTRLVPVSAPDAVGQPQHRIDASHPEPLPVLAYSEASGLGQTMALEGRGLAAVARLVKQVLPPCREPPARCWPGRKPNG